MVPNLRGNLTPLPPFPAREGGKLSLSPSRREVWREVFSFPEMSISYSIFPNLYFTVPKTGATSALAISGVTFPLA